MWSTLGRVSALALKLLSRVLAVTGDAGPATRRDLRFVPPDVSGDVVCDGPERPIGARDRRRPDAVSGDQRLDSSANARDVALPVREPVRRVEDTRRGFRGPDPETGAAAEREAHPPQAAWLCERPRRDRRARRLPEEGRSDRSAPAARP